MSKEHRLGVSEINLVERHLKVQKATEEQVCAAVEEIDSLYGIDEVSFDPENQMFLLEYDASRLCIDSLEKLISKHDIEISQDLWSKFKEGYYRFVDQNVHDNHTHTPWSCHKK
jgi:hypothetical protein